MRACSTLWIVSSLLLWAGCGDEAVNDDGGAANNPNNAVNNAVNNPANNASNNAPNNPNNNASNNANNPNNSAANNGLVQPVGGPNGLVSLNELLDASTLDLVVDANGSGLVQSGDAEAFHVSFQFTSQTWLGTQWRHQASLYLPTVTATGSDLLGIVHRDEVGGFSQSFGVLTAALQGTPVLIIDGLPPQMDLNAAAPAPWLAQIEGRCKGGPLAQVEVWTRCLFQAVHASDDPSLDPFFHIALTYNRGISAVQNLLPAIQAARLDRADPPPPTFSVGRAALMGAGQRGSALPIAAAIDPRVVAIFPSGAPFGALPEYFALQKRVWASEHPLGDPAAWERFLASEAGADYQEKLDLAQWPAELLADKLILQGWGTQTTYAPLEAHNLYRDALPSRTYDLALFDYGDGLASELHLPMWNVFLQAADARRLLPTVEVSVQDERGNVAVTARLDARQNTISEVALLYVSRHRDRDDDDFRDALWDAAPMEVKDDGSYNGVFTPLGKHAAVVIAVTHTGGDPGSDGVITSPVTLITLP